MRGTKNRKLIRASSQLGTGVIINETLVPAAVTNPKIAPAVVTSDKRPADLGNAPHIVADDAVSTQKLADASIDGDALSDGQSLQAANTVSPDQFDFTLYFKPVMHAWGAAAFQNITNADHTNILSHIDFDNAGCFLDPDYVTRNAPESFFFQPGLYLSELVVDFYSTTAMTFAFHHLMKNTTESLVRFGGDRAANVNQRQAVQSRCVFEVTDATDFYSIGRQGANAQTHYHYSPGTTWQVWKLG